MPICVFNTLRNMDVRVANISGSGERSMVVTLPAQKGVVIESDFFLHSNKMSNDKNELSARKKEYKDRQLAFREVFFENK